LLCHSRSLWRRAWQDRASQNYTRRTRLRPRRRPQCARPRPIFWSQTGLVLRPTVSDHITVICIIRWVCICKLYLLHCLLRDPACKTLMKQQTYLLTYLLQTYQHSTGAGIHMAESAVTRYYTAGMGPLQTFTAAAIINHRDLKVNDS